MIHNVFQVFTLFNILRQDQAQKKSSISEDLDEEIYQTQKENV